MVDLLHLVDGSVRPGASDLLEGIPMRRAIVVAALSFVPVLPFPALAAWTPLRVRVTSLSSDQVPYSLVPSTNGMIVGWVDYRNGSANPDVYCRAVDSTGVLRWADEVALCTQPGAQEFPLGVVSGDGGAIFAWTDQRSGDGDIYVQRIDANGTAQWQAQGAPICAASGSQTLSSIAPDGRVSASQLPGAFVAWQDTRAGGTSKVYVQHMSTQGTASWTSDGVAVCPNATNQSLPVMARDGTGIASGLQGVVVAWLRRDAFNVADIVAQRVKGGVLQWDSNGLPIVTAPQSQFSPQVAYAGSGNVIVWSDQRVNPWQIYTQRLNSSGAESWPQNGTLLAPGIAPQTNPDSSRKATVERSWSGKTAARGRSISTCSGWTRTVKRCGRTRESPCARRPAPSSNRISSRAAPV